MTEVELIIDKPIAAYDEFRSQLSELKESNSKAVFDYADPKGNKEARSHVFKLRKTKTAIDKVRKEQKKASLEYGRKVDDEAKSITLEVEEMIDVHEKPLKEIEQNEKDRKAAIEEKFDLIVGARNVNLQTASIELISDHIGDLKELEPDDSFDEYMAEATREYKTSIAHLEGLLTSAKIALAEKEELEHLRKESDERARKEREEQIAKDAREAAESKAESDRIAAERKVEADKQAAIENEKRIEREKEEAIERETAAKRELEEANKQHKREQEQAVIDTEARVKREAEEEERRLREEAEKREANKKHKASVNNKAVQCLISGGISKEIAKEVVILIAKKEIDYVSIAY